MKPLLLSALLLLSVSFFAQNTLPSQLIWFDQVKKPASYTEPQLLDLTRKLHGILQNGSPFKTLSEAVQDDHSPRVVFLTIGDDLWPARTYYGTGFSFMDALSKAVEILRGNETARKEQILKEAASIIEDAKREKRRVPSEWIDRQATPGQWNWLKLHVVQASKPYPGFTFNNSRFSQTDLVGFSFGPDLGFAFTPDQLTGRYLLTPKGYLSKKQVGNIIAEAYNFEALNIWLQVTSFNAPQGICFFEADTYFTDGITASRLFRCHSLPSIPDARQCLEAARKAAIALGERIDARTGEVTAPFADWKASSDTGELLDDMAELSIALRHVADASDNTAIRAAASRALLPFKDAIVTFGEQKEHTAFAELEQIPDTAQRQPRTYATLRNNALYLIAALPLADKHSKDQKLLRQQKAVASFVAQLHDRLGMFHNARIVPAGKFTDFHEDDLSSRVTDNALAAIALHKAAEAFGVPEWETLSRDAVNAIVAKLEPVAVSELNVDPWVIEALTLHSSISHKHNALMPRLAAALMSARTLKPAAPDLAGSPAAYPSYAAAARSAWAMSALAAWFHPFNADYEEALAAENALGTSFHIQARMDLATASSLPRPRYYLDFFRNYPDDFQFTLYGHSSQLMALVKTAALLNAFHKGHFPEEAAAARRLAAVRKFINVHPGFISLECITTTSEQSEESRAIIGTTTNRRSSVGQPAKNGLAPKNKERRRR